MQRAAPTEFSWRSESDAQKPDRLIVVDDRLRADEAMRRLRQGEWLLYCGDFHNAKQLLSAVRRRLPAPKHSKTPLAAFRAEREARTLEHETLGRIVVYLNRDYKLLLGRSPNVAEACLEAWGAPDHDVTVVPLKTLMGVLGAAEWRKTGLRVPGLPKPLTPHYGVYVPTRTDYVELMAHVKDVKEKTVFDIGTGTGVLALLLLQKGAHRVVATDMEPRAVVCARQNAAQFGVTHRFSVEQRSLFPEGRADIVVCNPPWVPEAPKNRIDRAVFDDNSTMLTGFLGGLGDRLNPAGRGLLLLSNLPELLGLRSPHWLSLQFEASDLRVLETHSTTAKHARARDTTDPLHVVRAAEKTTLYVLGQKSSLDRARHTE